MSLRQNLHRRASEIFRRLDIYPEFNQVRLDALRAIARRRTRAAGENRKIEPGKKKCEITLTVSLGPKTMKMSDEVTRLPRGDASAQEDGTCVSIGVDHKRSLRCRTRYILCARSGNCAEAETALCCTSARAQAATDHRAELRARPRSSAWRRQPRRDSHRRCVI